MTRKNIVLLLTVLFIVDAIVVGTLVGAVNRSVGVGLLAGAGAIALPFTLVGLLITGILRAAGWGRLVSAFPAVPPADGVVGKMADSLKIGGVSMNNAIECAVDDNYLHLTPLMSFGRLCPPVSIPWEHVTFPEGDTPKVGLLTGKRVHLVAQGVKMWVPAAIVERELAVRSAIERESVAAAPDGPARE